MIFLAAFPYLLAVSVVNVLSIAITEWSLCAGMSDEAKGDETIGDGTEKLGDDTVECEVVGDALGRNEKVDGDEGDEMVGEGEGDEKGDEKGDELGENDGRADRLEEDGPFDADGRRALPNA